MSRKAEAAFDLLSQKIGLKTSGCLRLTIPIQERMVQRTGMEASVGWIPPGTVATLYHRFYRDMLQIRDSVHSVNCCCKLLAPGSSCSSLSSDYLSMCDSSSYYFNLYLGRVRATESASSDSSSSSSSSSTSISSYVDSYHALLTSHPSSLITDDADLLVVSTPSDYFSQEYDLDEIVGRFLCLCERYHLGWIGQKL
jgi:hypothetical protein